MKSWIWVFLFFLTACSQEPIFHKFQGIAMTMPYKIFVGHRLTSKEKHRIATVLEETFSEINTVYNRWNPQSEISQINQEKGPFTLSKKLTKFFAMVDEIVDITEGRFDPTIFPLLEGQELIDPKQIGWKKSKRTGNVLQKAHPHMTFDFCGIAKGYCVDLLTEKLQEMGYKNLLVEWAGDMRASGNHPENRPWWVQVRLSSALQVECPIIYLQDSSIATSSESISAIKAMNLSYSHIIDPIEKKPHEQIATSVLAVSVQAKSCAKADALATAALTFSHEAQTTSWAEKIAETDPTIVIWLVKKDS